jgi:hypothetical protein
VGGVVVDNQLQVMAGIAQGTAQPLHLGSLLRCANLRLISCSKSRLADARGASSPGARNRHKCRSQPSHFPLRRTKNLEGSRGARLPSRLAGRNGHGRAGTSYTTRMDVTRQASAWIFEKPTHPVDVSASHG